MFKRLLSSSLVGFLLLLGLNGCFFSSAPDATSSKIANGKLFEVDEFTIEYPRDWRVLTAKDFPSDVPKETKVVFQNNVKGEFTASVNIGRVKLDQVVSSLDYAKRVVQEERSAMFNFTEVKSEDIQLSVAGALTDTLLYTFTGKSSPEATERKYIQTFLIKEDYVYLVTGAMMTNEEDNVVLYVEGMLKSFTLK